MVNVQRGADKHVVFDRFTKMPDTWQAIAQRKKGQQASRIPKEWILPEITAPRVNSNHVLDVPRRCGLLSEKELNITEEYDATALVGELAAGRLSCKDVAVAFCKVCRELQFRIL